MTFLVAALVGGFRLGIFSLSLVLISFNYIVLTGFPELPIELQAKLRYTWLNSTWRNYYKWRHIAV